MKIKKSLAILATVLFIIIGITACGGSTGSTGSQNPGQQSTGTGYQYEDNEGKYPAEFKDGVLKVKASDTNTVDVYIDPQTGHLMSSFQGSISEFKKAVAEK